MLFKKNFFSKSELDSLKEAIQFAEAKTSGEIRVYLEPKGGDDVIAHATKVFHHLKMNETTHHNGVLFYLAYTDRKFAVIGDEGIHKHVGDHFWDDVKNIMQENFGRKEFLRGLVKGIEMTGDKLKQHYPHMKDGKNELPDDIIMK